MTYKCEAQLRERAEKFIATLRQAGIDVMPHPAMFRDYMVKISAGEGGNIKIHYSPKRENFTLNLSELRDAALKPHIEQCWHQGISSDVSEPPACDYQTYVDGSFRDGTVGYGAVVLYKGEAIQRFSGTVEQHTEQRQVVGELEATMQVIAWCEENAVPEIEIFYDYTGIEHWATGAWKANNPATQHYQQVMRATPTTVIWQKVKSHSGVHWNEVVDELAKQATSVQSEDEDDEDPLAVLEQVATDFVNYLGEQGVDATYTQIYNGQFARLIVIDGYFDLYNTAKRPLHPYLHNFKDAKLQQQLETFWHQWRSPVVEDKPPVTGLEEIAYYLELLAPYRHLRFDFSTLARSIAKVTGTMPPTDDYDTLEQIYLQMRNQR